MPGAALRASLAALAALWLIAAPNASAELTFGSASTVPDSGYFSSNLDAATDSGGAASLAWIALVDPLAGKGQVRFARVAADGRPGPSIALSGTVNVGVTPRLADDGRGGTFVTWESGGEVVLVRVDASGTAAPPLQIAAPGSGAQDPVVVVRKGLPTVVYRDGRDRRTAVVRAASVEQSGRVLREPVSRPGRVASVMAVADGGRVVATWAERRGRTTRIMASRFGGGVDPGPIVLRRSRGALTQRRPELAANPGGGAIAVWEAVQKRAGRGTYPSTIFAGRISSTGAAGPVAAVTDESGHAFAPEIGVDRRGRATVAWKRGRRISLVRLNGRLRPGRPVRASRGGGYPSDPHLAVAPDGRALLTWSYCCGKRIEIDATRVASGRAPRRPAIVYSGTDQLDGEPLTLIGKGDRPLVAWTQRLGGVRVSLAAK